MITTRVREQRLDVRKTGFVFAVDHITLKFLQ